MDYEDLMDFEENDVGPMACYVCGTTVEVQEQDVITNVETLEAVVLPVCNRCSSAVGVVVELEDVMFGATRENIELYEENRKLTDKNVELAALLAEGVLHVLNLASQNEALQERVAALEAFIAMQDEEADALFVENSSLLDQVDDLERRIEAGAGLNDVEVTVIASADYED